MTDGYFAATDFVDHRHTSRHRSTGVKRVPAFLAPPFGDAVKFTQASFKALALHASCVA